MGVGMWRGGSSRVFFVGCGDAGAEEVGTGMGLGMVWGSVNENARDGRWRGGAVARWVIMGRGWRWEGVGGGGKLGCSDSGLGCLVVGARLWCLTGVSSGACLA